MDCRRLSRTQHWVLLCALLMIAQADEDNTRALGRTINRLGLNLHRVLSKEQPNTLTSPYSLATILGILYEGAAGNTRQKMGDALGFSTYFDISKIFGELRLSMSCKHSKTCSVVGATGIFPSITVDILSEFLDATQGQMGLELLPMNYADTKKSEDTLNDWVSNKTNGLIKGIISLIRPSTVLILINTIYLKASWKKRFCVSDTQIENFYLGNGQTVSCPMMKHASLSTNVGQSVSLDALIVEIPFTVDDLSLYIISPNKEAGLRMLEDKINETMIDGVIKTMHKKPVELIMPKFNMSNSLELMTAVSDLGLEDALSGDFGRISPIVIDLTGFRQESYIKVDEQGVEASAATAATMDRLALHNNMQIVLNHPFLFFIRHRPSGIIVFLGRVGNPLSNVTMATWDVFKGLQNPSNAPSVMVWIALAAAQSASLLQ